jgi:hypothetical protein
MRPPVSWLFITAHGPVCRRVNVLSFFLCGLCLGLAFALKLWLFGPYALAVSVLLLSRHGARWHVRAEAAPVFSRRAWRHHPCGIPPARGSVLSPEDLQFWLRKVYFGFFIREGISGGKFSGDVIDPRWVHPIWYYAGVFYRDHFFLVPWFSWESLPCCAMRASIASSFG